MAKRYNAVVASASQFTSGLLRRSASAYAQAAVHELDRAHPLTVGEEHCTCEAVQVGASDEPHVSRVKHVGAGETRRVELG